MKTENMYKETAVLKLKVEANGPSLHMKGENAEIDMIPFKGTAEGPYFNGIIEPCGVDTQVVNAAHVRHMSARYMLTGTDCAGKDAHIYVDNNCWIDDLAKTMPFHTVPTIYTDSEALAPLLHRNQFAGIGVIEEDGLWIYIYPIIEISK